MSRQWIFGAGVLAIVLSATALYAGQAPAPALSKQDSESLQKKLAAIEARGNHPSTNAATPLRT